MSATYYHRNRLNIRGKECNGVNFEKLLYVILPIILISIAIGYFTNIAGGISIGLIALVLVAFHHKKNSLKSYSFSLESREGTSVTNLISDQVAKITHGKIIIHASDMRPNIGEITIQLPENDLYALDNLKRVLSDSGVDIVMKTNVDPCQMQ